MDKCLPVDNFISLSICRYVDNLTRGVLISEPDPVIVTHEKFLLYYRGDNIFYAQNERYYYLSVRF